MIAILLRLFRLLPVLCGSHRHLALENLAFRHQFIGGGAPFRRSTIVTSQLPPRSPPGQWHDHLGEPTLADAICDRLLHSAHRLVLKGPSRREETKLDPPGTGGGRAQCLAPSRPGIPPGLVGTLPGTPRLKLPRRRAWIPGRWSVRPALPPGVQAFSANPLAGIRAVGEMHRRVLGPGRSR
jgi:hypothetical protein